jgi:Domain of Unknown Function (DUF1080)
MRHPITRRAAAVLALVALGACVSRNRSNDSVGNVGTAPANAMPAAGGAMGGMAMAGDWKPLIDPTMSQWRAYKTQTMPASWHVTDGVLSKSGGVEDLVSRDQYGDFELSWDWMLSKGGNAGVFYRTSEEYDHVYWSGPEYQLLDDANHPDGRNRLTSAGAAYALYPPPAGVVKAAGEWNSSRIVAKGNHVEHYLNGQKVVEYDLMSPDWEAKVKASKFVEWPHYGRAPRGFLALQGDHDGMLSIRDLKIREIK